MAMFECPGCKSIVDDSIKKCPKCGYDIKKYVKSMGKTKKGGKSDEGVSFTLASAYSAKTTTANMPTLDFLSKPAQPAPAPVMAEPEVTPAAPAPAPIAEPVVTAPAPAVNPVLQPQASSFGFSVEQIAPMVTPSAPEPVVAEPEPVVAPEPIVEPEITTPEPEVVSFDSDIPQDINSHFTDYSSVQVSSTPSMYEDPSYISPIAPASVPEPQAYTSEGTVQMPSYDTSSVTRVHIPAPASVAPERKPIVPNAPIEPPKPVYEDTVQPTVSLEPVRPMQPAAPVNPAQPTISMSNAGYAKLTEAPAEPPVFDSPVLNAAQANNVRPVQPASEASLNSQQYNSSSFGSAPIPRPAAAPMPSYNAASVNRVPAGMPVTPKNEPEVDGIFDSPLLNAQAKRIASGEYVPTSVASQASISAMQQRKLVAPPPPGTGLSHTTFSQGAYGQQSGYKAPAQPLVYQEQAPIGQVAYQPQYQAAPTTRETTFSPVYGSFNNNGGANGSNINIPTNGPAGPGAANPLLAGNPLLSNGGVRQ